MNKIFLTFISLSVIFTGACTPQWSFLIESPGQEILINNEVLKEYQYFKNAGNQCEGIPLEIVMYQKGFNSIESVEFYDLNNKNYTYSWENITETVCISEKGTIILDEKVFHPEAITVIPGQYNELQRSLLDIFPTVMSALNIVIDEGEYRKPLVDHKTDHVVLIFLDGLNNGHYISALENEMLAEFSNPEAYEPALTVFPPRTTVASAAIITGKSPSENGVFKSGIRKTIEKTMFDLAIEKGLSVVSVEGESIPFNLAKSEVILSGDRDGNGSTDDNVFSNVIEILENGIPNLFYIHFHGIDDMGHSYGPDSPEVWEKIVEIDEYLAEIIQLLPEDCMVIMFADHGMHEIQGDNGRGNHGNLIDEDMVVFINILIK